MVLALGALAGVLLAAPVRAEKKLGTASDAQPGVGRVAVAERTDPAFAATVGYGYTEKLEGAEGPSHRIPVRLAGAVGLGRYLNVGALVDGRYDKHGSDSGTLIEGGIAARLAAELGSLRLGAEVKGWVPGSESASTTFKATSLDARALFGMRFGSALIGLNGGYRLDRGAEAGELAPRYSFGDRAAVGLSEFDAVLVGIGAAVALGRTELLLEGSGDLLVGSGAPGLSKSPLRASAGARFAITKRLFAEVLVNVSLSSRPEVSPTAPLVPIEPRVLGLAGLRYRFGKASSAVMTPPPPPAPAPAVTAPAAPKVEEAPFEVVVTDDQGAPLRDAKVTLKIQGEPRDLRGDDAGRYRDDHVPKGPAELTIEAPGFEPMKRDVTVEAGVPVNFPVKLTAVPPPSQVRGVVRTFGGEALAARIRVEPLGVETTTDASGAFQADVPPGSYEVTIEAKGYETQRRKVEVADQGVVVLNADLVKKKR